MLLNSRHELYVGWTNVVKADFDVYKASVFTN